MKSCFISVLGSVTLLSMQQIWKQPLPQGKHFLHYSTVFLHFLKKLYTQRPSPECAFGCCSPLILKQHRLYFLQTHRVPYWSPWRQILETWGKVSHYSAQFIECNYHRHSKSYAAIKLSCIMRVQLSQHTDRRSCRDTVKNYYTVVPFLNIGHVQNKCSCRGINERVNFTCRGKHFKSESHLHISS